MSDHPPISSQTQMGGVERREDGDYVWWWSEMSCTRVRVRKASDHQGIPSWALRQIADDMDARVADPPPAPTIDEGMRMEKMRERILAGVRPFPQIYDELWATCGRPNGADGSAFDMVLGFMVEKHEIRTNDIGGRRAYSKVGT
jgi:hypothetical protein